MLSNRLLNVLLETKIYLEIILEIPHSTLKNTMLFEQGRKSNNSTYKILIGKNLKLKKIHVNLFTKIYIKFQIYFSETSLLHRRYLM